MKKLPLADDVDLATLAQGTNNFSGADLASIAREAAMLAIRTANVPEEPKEGEDDASKIRITASLLARERERVTPSVAPDECKEYEAMAERLCGWRRREPQ